MKLYNGSRELRKNGYTKSGYPLAGILFAVALLYAAMLVSWYLVYPVFLICIYRVVRYDTKVFSTDYCILIPLATLFQTSGGMSLLIYVCLFAAIWYVLRGGAYMNAAFLFLILLLNYMFLRMQMEISRMILFFGQLFMLYVLLPHQDADSAERSAKAYCVSLVVSSVYALIFRNSAGMIALRGKEVPAFWGSSAMRFQGLFGDPNYYMLLLITGIALLLKLRDSHRIRRFSFMTMAAGLSLLGLLTYSKTFLLVFVLLAGIYVLWQFRNKKFFFGLALAVVMIGGAALLLLADFSPLSIIGTRLFSSYNISDLTTGRTDVFARYWNSITRNAGSFLFGNGFAAKRLGKDPHNLYLEIWYYSGAVGLLLMAGFYSSMVRMVQRKTSGFAKQNVFAKYVVLLAILTVFMSLHGVFSILIYGEFYLAFLSILLTRKNEVT